MGSVPGDGGLRSQELHGSAKWGKCNSDQGQVWPDFFYTEVSISLQKEMVTHSSILAWKIPWTEEEPGRLQSMGSQRVGHNWAIEHLLGLKVAFFKILSCVQTHFCIIFPFGGILLDGWIYFSIKFSHICYLSSFHFFIPYSMFWGYFSRFCFMWIDTIFL